MEELEVERVDARQKQRKLEGGEGACREMMKRQVEQDPRMAAKAGRASQVSRIPALHQPRRDDCKG